MADATALKDQGNKAFAAKNYDSAIDLFSQAIALDPTNHVLFSNRSAAKVGKKQWTEALEDAEQCIKLNPSWAKGYVRKGAALHGARKYDEAIAAYEEGIKFEDSPALRKGLKEVQDAKASSSGEGFGMGKMFADPNLLAKLAANPRTSKHLADPSFIQKLQMIQQNPRLAESMLGSDPRMIDVLGALMGIDMQGFARDEGSDELPPGVSKQPTSPPPPAAATPTPTASSSTPKPEAPKPAPAAEPEDAEMNEEEDQEEAKAKAEAEAEKAKGAAAYKARDLATAEAHFSKAWDLWPKDVTYLSNLGAVYFEQGEYDKAIETCEKAVDAGRELRADYKLVAKALGRIGSSYAKKGSLADAIKFYNKSLTEHRTPDVLNKLRDAEKQLAEQERQAYVDPAKGAEEREEGNKLFKAGDFVGAVKHYTECVKRDPTDPRGWTNRAAAYQKLAALPEALKDADKAISVDPKYVKAYIRKSHVLFGMREYTKALDAVQEAAEHDDEHKSTAEIQQQMIKINQAIGQERASETDEQTLARAMRDPEVAEIMNDPVMRSILEQAQNDPPSIQEHMKNPLIRQKITKLINAGILRTR